MTFTTNAAAFSKQVEKVAKTLPQEQVAVFVEKIGLEVLKKTIFATKVKTGRARGGWQIEFGSPPTGQAPFDKDGNATFETGSTKLHTGLSGNPYQLVFIGNNVEYIIYLEEGTDRFAGDHMLQNAIDLVASSLPN